MFKKIVSTLQITILVITLGLFLSGIPYETLEHYIMSKSDYNISQLTVTSDDGKSVTIHDKNSINGIMNILTISKNLNSK